MRKKVKQECEHNVLCIQNSEQIPFQRVDTDEAITMEDCVTIDEKLDMNIVKTLFLCNRQQTEFYLFITVGKKSFRSKDFSNALGVARVSFAPAEQMERILGTKIGAATVFSSLLDTENKVRIVFDKEVIAEKWYGCSDGTLSKSNCCKSGNFHPHKWNGEK